MKAFFVTGTDTGVGKTTVACALLAAARARGLRALGMKPIETGCVAGPDGLPLPLDAIALESAARERPAPDGLPPPLDAIALERAARERPAAALYNIYRFAAPLAPSVAAELEGAAIALAPILRGVDRLRSLAPDLLLVEGAGGLLVPLTASIDMADLAVALALPLIVVARDGLGTINHTLLTLEAAAARGLEVAAVILSGGTPGTSDRDATRNAEEIARRGRVPVVGRLPHLASLAAPPPRPGARLAVTPDAPRSPARTQSTRADTARASDVRRGPSNADPTRPGHSRTEPARTDTARAVNARTNSTPAHRARASHAPADPASTDDANEGRTRPSSPRASDTRTDSAHPDQASASLTGATSTSAGPPGLDEPRGAPSVEQLGPSRAQLAAAAEAHLDLAFLLPDDVV